ncbi:hypothetical protein SKAU_G00430460 [Synaphobranchus kaupii]|uniref:Uncharacterized protein n=1 Tax=Synaphobranchus kaupii TaxID=118154 RepID=A0A9Q1E4D8_SYNKA|nr:hypothetical protein SKAU_G00430460 [Synaphobranchus kaupii]
MSELGGAPRASVCVCSYARRLCMCSDTVASDVSSPTPPPRLEGNGPPPPPLPSFSPERWVETDSVYGARCLAAYSPRGTPIGHFFPLAALHLLMKQGLGDLTDCDRVSWRCLTAVMSAVLLRRNAGIILGFQAAFKTECGAISGRTLYILY